MLSGSQFSKPYFSWGGISGIEKDCDGMVVTSVTNGDACSSGNVSLTLEISLRVERGNEGKWHVLSSMINEVGSVAVKPSGDKKLHSFETMSTNDCGPGFKNVWAKAPASWQPKAQAGHLNVLPHKPKSKLQRSRTKPTLFISDETQPSVVPIESSSLACNSEVQSSESSPQPNDSGFHDPGIGSSLSATVIPPFASTSLSVPLNVFPGSGSLAPSTFSACDADFGLPPMLSSMLPDQSPLYTHTVGISSPTSVAAGMGSEEVIFEADSVKSSQQAVGSEKTEQLSTVAPLDFGPRISDYVGNLSRTWVPSFYSAKKKAANGNPSSMYCDFSIQPPMITEKVARLTTHRAQTVLGKNVTLGVELLLMQIRYLICLPKIIACLRELLLLQPFLIRQSLTLTCN
ncbi:hypothetical protein CMV_009903 [Castanea mollissima]|uniref:Uncharacterized protein n=1 Tax=Castanea mollissima TaxID=60419 RepID=A0A8J4VMH0_9ROSI|nr:hypothetical protein CMV_009903 [Castanea mollissima]